jgi:hypothetical protein
MFLLKELMLYTSFNITHASDFECTFKRIVDIGPSALSTEASAIPVSCENLATV